MIELKNVSKFYNDNKIVTVGLRNVSLKLNKGEFVAITGDSGSGKSTLLNVISSIDSYDDGEILFYGNETFYFNQNDSDIFRKNNVSFIFQKYNIVDSYTVLENVMLPLIIKGKSEEEAKREALEIIARVGLEARADHRGTKLSGGEKQRCVIARALATDAPILACDEPTGNLDSKTSKEIIDLIKEVSGDKLVLVVTHDYESIKDVCTRKIKMSDGEIVEDITFSEGIEEADHKLDLDDSKPRGKTLLRLASLNILSTPKKTVFSTMVFTFVSCVFLLLRF
jgi:ABC-type lipoprotein export system ATPase subunit